MKIKSKANLIEWLYVLMFFPFGIIFITLFFIILSLFFSDAPLVIPWDQLLIEGIILVSFICIYLVIVVFYKKFLVISNNLISLSNKDGSTTNIDKSDIISMSFYKTPIYLVPLTLLTNGNTLVIIYMSDREVRKSIKVKLFYKTIKKIMKSFNYNIDIIKPKFNK